MSNFNSIPVVSKASFKGEFDFCNAGDLLKQSGTGAVLVMTSSPESQHRFSEDPGKSSAVIVTA